MGYVGGDRVLVEIARRLLEFASSPDGVARLGSDDFALALDAWQEWGDVREAVGRVLARLAEPMALDGRSVAVRARAGVASSQHAACPDELLRHASVALHLAKRSSERAWVEFDPASCRALLDQAELQADLHRSVERRELGVRYQPVVHLATGRVVGVEALMRWRHPRRGLIAPVEFIPLAEEMGTIVAMGAWVLRQACHQIKVWQGRWPTSPPLTLWINLSPRQLVAEELAEGIVRVLSEVGLPVESLVLEITESALALEQDVALARLKALRGLGVRFALDDFGTGHSSLLRLREVPVDFVKIDRRFVQGVGRTASDEALVAAVLALGSTLGFSATAEGIERRCQWEYLRDLGCELGQGYLFARPLRAAEMERLLAGQWRAEGVAWPWRSRGRGASRRSHPGA